MVSYPGSISPIPVKEFKEHVQKMHSNDDYLFSEEYSVRSTIQLYSH